MAYMISVGSGMPNALAELLRTQPLTPAKVEFAWRRAVGPALSRVTRATLRDTGTLEVAADTRQWKREIDRAAALLMSRLEPILGSGAVRRITVTSPASDRAPRRRATGRRSL